MGAQPGSGPAGRALPDEACAGKGVGSTGPGQRPAPSRGPAEVPWPEAAPTSAPRPRAAASRLLHAAWGRSTCRGRSSWWPGAFFGPRCCSQSYSVCLEHSWLWKTQGRHSFTHQVWVPLSEGPSSEKPAKAPAREAYTLGVGTRMKRAGQRVVHALVKVGVLRIGNCAGWLAAVI